MLLQRGFAQCCSFSDAFKIGDSVLLAIQLALESKTRLVCTIYGVSLTLQSSCTLGCTATDSSKVGDFILLAINQWSDERCSSLIHVSLIALREVGIGHLIALFTLRARFSLRTLLTLWTLRTPFALWPRLALFTLRTLLSLWTLYFTNIFPFRPGPHIKTTINDVSIAICLAHNIVQVFFKIQ